MAELEALVLLLGEALLVVALVRRDCCHCGACAARVGHADGDDSCGLCVERTTLGSCVGWQNVTVCIRCACVAVIDVPAATIFVRV